MLIVRVVGVQCNNLCMLPYIYTSIIALDWKLYLEIILFQINIYIYSIKVFNSLKVDGPDASSFEQFQMPLYNWHEMYAALH